MTFYEKKDKLSVNEKIALLTGSGAMEAVNLGKGAGLRMADGPLGVKTENDNSVCFPNPCLIASSFDVDLCYEIGLAMGAEARRSGVNLLLSPAINIKRNPLAGRNFEYYSEDPYLTGKLATAYARGVRETGIGVCVKHFACNNQESKRWVQDSVIDDDTLRNLYLKAFEMLVKAGVADAIMAAYNSVNGIQMNENVYLLESVLRKEWGYDGVVVSDWASVDNIVAAINGGLDLEMCGNASLSVPELTEAYKKGELSDLTIDRHV